MKTLIRGARLLDPAAGCDEVSDLLIDQGRIAAIGGQLDTGDAEIFDASGLWLLPGVIDLAARVPFGDLCRAELAAAATGGVTALCQAPDPHLALDDATDVRDLLRRCREHGATGVLPIGALSRGLEGAALTDMAALKAAGCVGVGNGRAWVQNSLVMRCAMRYAADLDLVVFITPRDPWLSDGSAHEGRMATRLGLTGIPAAAETASLARDLALVADTGVRAHFGPISSEKSVLLLREAMASGLPVSAHTAIHHLFLTEMDLAHYNPACRVDPPLRAQSDRDALRAAVAEGLLAVCSDHQPLSADAKMAPFEAVEPGIPGVQTLLSLGLRLVEEELLDAAALVRSLCNLPRKIIGRDPAALVVGAAADLVLLDPHGVWQVAPGQPDWLSAGKHTPFAGWELSGQVRGTLIGGRWALAPAGAGGRRVASGK